MKKIDLHTHTISTVSDSDFDFDMEKMKGYVDQLEIDAIAITNHNLFDSKQYFEIRKSKTLQNMIYYLLTNQNRHSIIIS